MGMDAGVRLFSRRRLPAGALTVGVLLLTSGMALRSGSHIAWAVSGVSVTYKAGWNLVGGPDGTNVQGVGNLYTLGGGGYTTSAGTDPVSGGKGYWAYYAADTTVTLNGAGLATATVPAPAGQYVMIGNPSGTQAVRVSGADSVFSYDPAAGAYRDGTTLAVGQGAWALSTVGGTITLTAFGPAQPIPLATATPSPSPASAAGAAPAAEETPIPGAAPLAVSGFVEPSLTTVTNTTAGDLVVGLSVLRAGRPAPAGTQISLRVSSTFFRATARGTLNGAFGLMEPLPLPALRNAPIIIHVEATLDGATATSDLTYISPH